jgi:hypothetical protein
MIETIDIAPTPAIKPVVTRKRVIAFSLQKSLREAVHHCRHDQQQCDPEVEGDDAEQKERKAEVADMNPGAAGTYWKLLSLSRKRNVLACGGND